MAEFKLCEPFGIDDGELDGKSPQECFVLGYELAQVDMLLRDKAAFERPIHADNFERITRSLLKAGRGYEIKWMPDDKSEDWRWLTVDARK
jgi:hypothetical protein